MNQADSTMRLLSCYPTSALLLEFAASIFSLSERKLLPGQNVSADIVSLRIIELAERLGRDTSTLFEPDSRIESMRTPFIASHRSFFDLACVELRRTNVVRASLMGPTFLLPDEVFSERNRRKPGKSFAHELRIRADYLNTVRIIVRNDKSRFRRTYLPYIEEGSEPRLVDEMLRVAAKIRCGEVLPRLEFRCVDIGFANPPHLFEQVALIGSRPRPDANVDGGWLITDKTSIATEVEKFDRVFLSSDRDQSWDKLEGFLAGLR